MVGIVIYGIPRNTRYFIWDVSNADMEDMFYSTGNFNYDLSDWDVSNVTNMEKMFELRF